MTQIFANILITAAAIAIIGISFNLIYSVARFIHFAHGIIFAAGAYFALLFKVYFSLPFFFSIFLAVVVCSLLGCLMESLIYYHLRQKSAHSLISLLASLGIYIFLQNIVSIFFGNETRSIRTGIVQEGLDIFGAKITPIQIVMICVSLILLIILLIVSKKTKIGSIMRAVANDPVLASISGINLDIVILWVFAIGSALAGLAGILVALDVDMTPTMGMTPLMMGVVAVIIGGSSIHGIALGALLLALAQQFGAWYVGSQWQDAIAFVILVLFFLFKPEGFFGKKTKSATV